MLIWVGLFFVPTSVWSGKVTFHFWYIVTIFAVQLLWGLLLYRIRKRLGTGVCPLTSLVQYLRGYPLTDPRNYDHAFIIEVCERLHIPLKPALLAKLLLLTIVIVTIQYFT